MCLLSCRCRCSGAPTISLVEVDGACDVGNLRVKAIKFYITE